MITRSVADETVYPPLSLLAYRNGQPLLAGSAITVMPADTPDRLAQSEAYCTALRPPVRQPSATWKASPLLTHATVALDAVQRELLVLDNRLIVVRDACTTSQEGGAGSAVADIRVDWILPTAQTRTIAGGADSGDLATMVVSNSAKVTRQAEQAENATILSATALCTGEPIVTLLYPHFGESPVDLQVAMIPVRVDEFTVGDDVVWALQIEEGGKPGVLLVAPGTEGTRKRVAGFSTTADLLWVRYGPDQYLRK